MIAEKQKNSEVFLKILVNNMIFDDVSLNVGWSLSLHGIDDSSRVLAFASVVIAPVACVQEVGQNSRVHVDQPGNFMLRLRLHV